MAFKFHFVREPDETDETFQERATTANEAMEDIDPKEPRLFSLEAIDLDDGYQRMTLIVEYRP